MLEGATSHDPTRSFPKHGKLSPRRRLDVVAAVAKVAVAEWIDAAGALVDPTTPVTPGRRPITARHRPAHPAHRVDTGTTTPPRSQVTA